MTAHRSQFAYCGLQNESHWSSSRAVAEPMSEPGWLPWRLPIVETAHMRRGSPPLSPQEHRATTHLNAGVN